MSCRKIGIKIINLVGVNGLAIFPNLSLSFFVLSSHVLSHYIVGFLQKVIKLTTFFWEITGFILSVCSKYHFQDLFFVIVQNSAIKNDGDSVSISVHAFCSLLSKTGNYVMTYWGLTAECFELVVDVLLQ
jgi:hypothetical protein